MNTHQQMVSRNRTITGTVGGGTAYLYTGPYQQADQLASYKNCQDVIDGTRNDHPLTILSVERRKAGRLNGTLFGNPAYDDWIPEGAYASDHLNLGIPHLSTMGATALARTNPNRPVVSLPLAIGELKDLPGLLKYVWKDLIRNKQVKKNFHNQVGNAYLAGIYGIAPMLSDALKLSDFTGHVDRRAKELKRLYSNGGLKRRAVLSTDSKDDSGYVYLDTITGNVIWGWRKQKTVAQTWATVRWLPTSQPPTGSSDEKYRKMARGLVLGLSSSFSRNSLRNGTAARNDFWSDASDAWNLMPWSWMVDWFANTGDFLDAHRNTIPATSTKLNVMRQTGTDTYYTGINYPSSVQVSPTYWARTTKERIPNPGVFLAANLPFLSGRQVSILGALQIQRLRIRR